MSRKVYKKVSNIPNAGDGLFAGEDINDATLITEFKGKIKSASNIKDNWSAIYICDDIVLECDKSNLASYANDNILFPSKRRNIIKIIEKELPLYNSYNDQQTNAEIYINTQLKRAWLKSTKPIKKDEEIFIHYGLQFWIKSEIYLDENEDPTDMPKGKFYLKKDIFTTESFKKYVKIFYPKVIKLEYSNNNETVHLIDNKGGGFTFTLESLLRL